MDRLWRYAENDEWKKVEAILIRLGLTEEERQAFMMGLSKGRGR